ncbi:MAG TPA: alpha-1,2-fucosyltransferase [Acidimicrobiales bacterium]|nr:alpha-1,2-fucosyltransferase [Acidimicrobiales bacterium]
MVVHEAARLTITYGYGSSLRTEPPLEQRRSLRLARSDERGMLHRSQYSGALEIVVVDQMSTDGTPGSDVAYVIVSDDLEWCRANLDLEPQVFVDLDAFSSLYLMTRCDVNVIANSSFSWWGAFLNPQAEVYAPSRWFYPDLPPPRDRQDDIVPPGWRTVPVFADWAGERIDNGTARP